MKFKTVQKTTEILVDSDTGEVLDIAVNKVQLLLDDTKFALVYSSLWDLIMDTNLSKADIELLGYLINQYGEGTIFSITSVIKEAVAKKSNKRPSSYNNSTKALLNAKFILEVKKRNYIINPQYAFKGSSNNRKKLILDLHCKQKLL